LLGEWAQRHAACEVGAAAAQRVAMLTTLVDATLPAALAELAREGEMAPAIVARLEAARDGIAGALRER
jgi:hypothetical protein